MGPGRESRLGAEPRPLEVTKMKRHLSNKNTAFRLKKYLRNSAKRDVFESFNGDWWGSWLKVVGKMGMINVICSALGMQALTKLLPLAPGLSNNDIVSIVCCCREQSLTKQGTLYTCPLGPGPRHWSRGQMSRPSPYSALTQHS